MLTQEYVKSPQSESVAINKSSQLVLIYEILQRNRKSFGNTYVKRQQVLLNEADLKILRVTLEILMAAVTKIEVQILKTKNKR